MLSILSVVHSQGHFCSQLAQWSKVNFLLCSVGGGDQRPATQVVRVYKRKPSLNWLHTDIPVCVFMVGCTVGSLVDFLEN